jgi:hypothetical protein
MIFRQRYPEPAVSLRTSGSEPHLDAVLMTSTLTQAPVRFTCTARWLPHAEENPGCHARPRGSTDPHPADESRSDTTGVRGRGRASRKFVIDLEAGYERAELDKTLAVFGKTGLSLSPPNLNAPR